MTDSRRMEGPRPGSSGKGSCDPDSGPHQEACMGAIALRDTGRAGDQKLAFCSAKRDVTDSPSEMRRIVSANRKATDSWRTFVVTLASGLSGIVLVMTTSSSAEPLMRSMAGPENTACVQ